ncbi:Ankyrin repeat-containing protein BDA1 [Camellia lanceoleosa]|uniref:Ankyrin repeat-containing protein BDA1 n=1 Tax=Camellia lanceoleosa TaxID=1840588 RepID=A0ACC0FGE9_9ERIC|nr:Ankyrin repeat-containing protein BDA1 [Camellia lanceoleosa]
MASTQQRNEFDWSAEFLCACPAAIEDRTIHGETALHIAVKSSNSEASEVLLGWMRRTHRRKILNRKDNEGNTVLHIAWANLLAAGFWFCLGKFLLLSRWAVMWCFNAQQSSSQLVKLGCFVYHILAAAHQGLAAGVCVHLGCVCICSAVCCYVDAGLGGSSPALLCTWKSAAGAWVLLPCYWVCSASCKDLCFGFALGSCIGCNLTAVKVLALLLLVHALLFSSLSFFFFFLGLVPHQTLGIVKSILDQNYNNRNAENFEGLTARDLAIRLDESEARREILDILTFPEFLNGALLANNNNRYSLAGFLKSGDGVLEGICGSILRVQSGLSLENPFLSLVRLLWCVLEVIRGWIGRLERSMKSAIYKLPLILRFILVICVVPVTIKTFNTITSTFGLGLPSRVVVDNNHNLPISNTTAYETSNEVAFRIASLIMVSLLFRSSVVVIDSELLSALVGCVFGFFVTSYWNEMIPSHKMKRFQMLQRDLGYHSAAISSACDRQSCLLCCQFCLWVVLVVVALNQAMLLV